MGRDTVKIILVGSSACGKTAILLRYIKQNFKFNTPSTIGASYLSKEITCSSGKELTLSVWDTAKSDCVIMVYDMTKEETFQDISRRWIKEVQINAPNDALLCLVGNKSDLLDQKRVSSQKGRNLAKRLGCFHFQECSALNGQNVDNIFNIIADKLGERYEPATPPKRTEDRNSSLEDDILKWQKEHEGKNKRGENAGGCCSG